jgi:4'-phosphopantetheinyl transferase
MMSTWSSCAQPNHLDEHEVHLWLVPLAVTPEKSSNFKSILSFDEQERAGRFQRKMDAKRYVAARGSLRSLLSRYLAIEPDRLEFTYDAFGKPRLAGEVPRTLLSFSVSHCDDLALIGFVLGHKIGVDLERVRTEIQVEDLAERYFSANELQRLRSLPANQRQEAFYCGWTRKEAYLKVFPPAWMALKSVWLRVNPRSFCEPPTIPMSLRTGLFNICRPRQVMLGR